MHNDDTIFYSGLRLFLSLLSYFLLFTLTESDELSALCISTFTYVMGKWVDVLDSILHRESGTLFEIIGTIVGIILAAASIFFIVNYADGSLPNWVAYFCLFFSAVFVIVDFSSFGTVLKKYLKSSKQEEKTTDE